MTGDGPASERPAELAGRSAGRTDGAGGGGDIPATNGGGRVAIAGNRTGYVRRPVPSSALGAHARFVHLVVSDFRSGLFRVDMSKADAYCFDRLVTQTSDIMVCWSGER
jgi:hypothetical protein